MTVRPPTKPAEPLVLVELSHVINVRVPSSPLLSQRSEGTGEPGRSPGGVPKPPWGLAAGSGHAAHPPVCPQGTSHPQCVTWDYSRT